MNQQLKENFKEIIGHKAKFKAFLKSLNLDVMQCKHIMESVDEVRVLIEQKELELAKKQNAILALQQHIAEECARLGISATDLGMQTIPPQKKNGPSSKPTFTSGKYRITDIHGYTRYWSAGRAPMQFRQAQSMGLVQVFEDCLYDNDLIIPEAFNDLRRCVAPGE